MLLRVRSMCSEFEYAFDTGRSGQSYSRFLCLSICIETKPPTVVGVSQEEHGRGCNHIQNSHTNFFGINNLNAFLEQLHQLNPLEPTRIVGAPF
jgi:hypothetical protein